MNKLLMLVLFVCAAFSAALGSVVASSGPSYNKKISDTVINGVKFRMYFYECESSSNETYILPIGGNETITEKIRQNLLSSLNSSYNSRTLEKDMDSFYARCNQSDGAEEDDMQEENIDNIMPIYVSSEYMSFYSSHFFIFVGEQSHGWTTDIVSVYSMKTGEKLSQNDILNDSETSKLAVAKKLYSVLVEKMEKDGGDVLVDAEDAMSLLNGNFYFTEENLVYCYDASMVASYMAGPQELELSKDWVRPYLKQNGPLYNYWFNK